MADFTAVLRKTLDGLGETSSETRARVYDKARAAIKKKLEAISPAPAQAVIDRQMRALEDAISEIESDYAVAEEPLAEEPLDDLDRLLAVPKAGPDAKGGKSASDPDGASGSQRTEETDSELPGRVKKKKKSRLGLWLILLFLVLGGAAAGAWFKNDLVRDMTGIDLKALFETKMPENAPAGELKTEPEAAKPEQAKTESEPVTEEPDAVTPKFTQRLTENGIEVDPGPADAEPTVGEGRSVATAVQPDTPAPEGGQTATEPTAAEPDKPVEPQQVVVGQKALLYEEGTGGDQGTADGGGVVWSVVQEAPGDGLREEPAIRGDLTIPEKGITMSITIRRNGDKTLPASHLVELYFQMPESYGGGGIAEMTRISMKESEQATGSPLLGVPARISDEFFLVALTDAEAAVDTNLALLRRQSWIDIPVSYLSGRRALFTLEKGLPGERVFNEVLKAWQDAGSG